ncbi:MAG: leucine-rich repeat domain-containing protein [Bacteroidales bacterium]|nr:leucine-rich repeat domain-containing protein [Bacteroidales bacterium]
MKKLILFLLTVLLPLVAFADAVEIDGIYYDLVTKAKEAKVINNPYADNDYKGDVVIPASVTYEGVDYSVTAIGAYAFNSCGQLTSVTIPNSVTSIGNGAFNKCYSLTSFTIPSGVTTVEPYTFCECRSLTSIDLGDKVTSIGTNAFVGCTGLTSITIPTSVEAIGEYAFSGCSLTSLHISDLVAWLGISFVGPDGSSNPLSCAKHLFLNGVEITELEIPDGITSIGDLAFFGFRNMTSVSIPNSVTSIGIRTFQSCDGLTSVTLPNSVTSLGACAFEDCIGLTSIDLGNSLKTIENTTFSGCSNLSSITIPNSVMYVGDHAFSRCSSLTSISIPNSVSWIGQYAFRECIGLASITIPNSVTSIGSHAFYKCSALTSITIPNSITSLGQYTFADCSGLTSVDMGNDLGAISNNVFQNCTSLTSVTIPNSVQTIGESAFWGCKGLTTLTIGSGVTGLFSRVFGKCSELEDVYCLAESVPYTIGNAFEDSYIEYATLHVPEGSVEAYKAEEPWKRFRNITALDGGTPETPKCATPTISYQNGKLSFSCETDDVVFVSDIEDADIQKHYEATIALTATYTITVYATKQGYANSDIVTATLCWIDQEPQTEGITDGLAQIPARPVLIKTDRGQIIVEGIDDHTSITLFTTDGKLAGSATSQNGTATIATHLPSGTTVIFKMGGKSVKVVVK